MAGYPLQYSGLENSMDWAHGVTKSWTRLSDFHFTSDLHKKPWTARRSNQSILKEISPRCFLEGLMLKLKVQYFGHLM